MSKRMDKMKITNEEIMISNDKNLLDFEVILGFLSRSYWANNRPEQTVRKSIEGSICFGAYHLNKQIGFARIVTDGATVYWLCDVFVEEAYRGQGVGKRLVESITKDDEYKNYFGILATRDAHELYEQYQFERDQGKCLTRKPDIFR
jgi:GNAT superfamily N-acetyltransferase